MQSEQLLNQGTLMKRIQLRVKEGTDFEDTTHSFVNRKANKNVGKESVGFLYMHFISNNRIIHANLWQDV